MNTNNTERMSLTISSELLDWLYSFTRTLKKQGGYQLPNTMIVRACVKVIKNLDIAHDLGVIKDEKKRGLADTDSSDELENVLVERIMQAIRTGKRRGNAKSSG